MTKLAMSLLATVVINIFVWIQMNGQFIKGAPAWLSSKALILAMGAPLGLSFWYATKWSYEHFGYTWGYRLTGFGLGTIVFGIMSWLILDEIPTTKTMISLMLAAAIILIQVSNVIE